MSKIKQVATLALQKTKDNSPALLTGVAVAGVLSTTILAVQGTSKALYLIEQEQYYQDTEGHKELLTPQEQVRVAWKAYIPTAVMATATIVCIVGANSVSTRRNAALAGLYSVTERTLNEYQHKIVEKLGEDEERAIRDEIAEDRMKAIPETEHTIIHTGTGDMLVFDPLSGRYFRSNQVKLDKAVNELNHNMLSEMTTSLNQLYTAFGLPEVRMGEELGWNIDDIIELRYDSKISPGGEPCLVIGFYNDPTARFRQL